MPRMLVLESIYDMSLGLFELLHLVHLLDDLVCLSDHVFLEVLIARVDLVIDVLVRLHDII